MEQELWMLTLKGDDIEGYNNRFHELALMCPDLVTPERKKIECYQFRLRPQELEKVTRESERIINGTTTTIPIISSRTGGRKLLKLIWRPQLRVEAMLEIYRYAINASCITSASAQLSAGNAKG
ncbi:hypothetical protein Tco_0991989 [Tanacetum coccineum]|uniref:Reverse transcriptase domain-containing protein n=1 Tax=Tanacetum coccineum TaxID=301880 RepID=A0ABQ5F120_9ASTR